MEKELKLNILVPQISTSKDELNQTKNKNWKPKKNIYLLVNPLHWLSNTEYFLIHCLGKS